MGKKNKKEKIQLKTGEKEKLRVKSFLFANSRIWTAAILIATVTFLIYLPALQNDFVRWDDHEYVYENADIRSINFKFLVWIFGFHVSNWHPLTWLSHAIDYAVWGSNPMGHHLSSIILHSANTFLLGILVVYLFLYKSPSRSAIPDINSKLPAGAAITAGVTALLFGIHPAHVESVAWIAERKDVLCAFFILLSLIFYVRYVADQKRSSYLLGLIFFGLALMSKPMAVTLPAVLVVLDIYPFRRLNLSADFKTRKKIFIEKAPFFILSLISAVLTILAQSARGAIRGFEAFPLTDRIIIAIKGVFFYLGKMIFPAGLSPYYPYPKNISFLSYEYFIPAILFLAATIFCVIAWKRGWKFFMATWAFYVITLLPVIGIIQVGEQAAADRYTYIPSIGPFLLIGLGVSSIRERLNKKVIVLLPAILIFVLLGRLTVDQIKVWKNSITLWTRVLEQFPDHERAYANRAQHYREVKDYSAEIKELTIAIKMNEKDDYYSNRGVAYLMLGDSRNGLKDLTRAIELNPAFFPAYFNRCKADFSLGEYHGAVQDCSKAVEIEPENALAYFGRGIAYRAIKEYQKAIHDFDRAIEIKPGYLEAYNERGATFGETGAVEKAIEDFSKAIEVNPRYSTAYYNRGVTYFKIGKEKEAILDFRRAAGLGNKAVQEILRKKGVSWQP